MRWIDNLLGWWFRSPVPQTETPAAKRPPVNIDPREIRLFVMHAAMLLNTLVLVNPNPDGTYDVNGDTLQPDRDAFEQWLRRKTAEARKHAARDKTPSDH